MGLLTSLIYFPIFMYHQRDILTVIYTTLQLSFPISTALERNVVVEIQPRIESKRFIPINSLFLLFYSTQNELTWPTNVKLRTFLCLQQRHNQHKKCAPSFVAIAPQNLLRFTPQTPSLLLNAPEPTYNPTKSQL